MTDEKNKRKLYDALSQDYDLGSFEQFSTDVEDEVKRRKLYDAIKEEYDFPDFDGFSRQLVGEPKPKPAAQQQVQPYNGDFTMRESELEKGNSQQPTGNRQQATKPAKTQPAKPKAAPITTPNIPSIQQMMDNRPQFKPVMQSEVGLDANGNRVRKPKVTKEPIGNTPQTAPVYRDFMGNTYDATDPNVQKEVERQTVTVPLDVKKANREQVADLSQSIDDALNDAKGEVMRLYREQSDILYPLGAPGADAIEMLASTRMMQKYGDGIPDAQVAGQRVRDLEAAQRSMRDAQRIINEADHNAKEGTFGKWLESSFAGGAVRGFGQKLFDVDTWDMGMSEMQDATSFKKALKAFDEGKQLTESQKLMLDAKAVELATNAYFGSYVGRGYKAGNVTAESVPFMIEMCLNPASGTGHAAQNAMARYAIKRFGKKVVKDNAKKYLATKVATRVAGDIVGAGIMAGTTGMVGVAADAQNRMNGDVRFDINDEGKSVFVGHDNQKDFGTAFKEAFAARTIENYSEMFGEYFSPLIGAAGKGIGKGLSKFGLDNVNKFVENVAASDIARLVSDFERRSKWNGTIGEYAEEVVGGVMNALIVGDQTLDTNKDTGVFNLDNNIDTFLGVSLFGGAISSVKTLGYRTPKYTARHNMTEADNAAAQIFGNQDTWGDIRNTIAVGDDADVKAKLKEVLSNPDVSAEQKLATLQYAKTVQEYKGVLAGETKRRAEQAPVQTDLETSFDNGYMLEGQEMNDAKNMLDFQRQRIGEIAADDMLQQLDEEPVSALDFIRTNEDWSDEEKQTAIDYVNAKATYEGMLQRVADDVDGRIAESNRLISERTSKTDGMIHPAVLKAENKQVYIVDGNVMMMPDGSMVDSDNSDESVIVRDAETGEISFVSPADILMVEEALDAEEERQTAQEAIRQQFAKQAADEIEGVLPFNDGDVYDVIDEEGQQHTIEIVPAGEVAGTLAEGQVLVSVDGAYIPIAMSRNEIQNMADAYNLTRLAEYEQAKAAQTVEQAEENGLNVQDGQSESDVAPVDDSMPMIGEGEDAEPDFLATTPERAHSYLYNEAGLSRDEANQFVDANKKAADKELEKAKKGKPQMGTSLAKYKKEQSEYQQKVDAAQYVADYWQAVKDAQQLVLAGELDARAAEDAANIAQAQQEELLRQEEELRKQAAQAALGTNNVAPAIREKWDAAPKVEGARNEIVLANGERVPGKYVLVESGAATPSHNPTAEFAKNEGFPVDENGQSVNDRDYEGDKDAQTITRQIASNYDQRALQSPVVVTNDGVVLSGNGRTMAGELAARDNTDGAYIGYLLEHPELFGFTKEQVESMAHPRVLFVPDEAMPYTADTFAKFNQQEMKGQSKTEQAVKLGKLVDDATFGRVIRSMNAYDTLGDFYADIATSTKAINELRDAGAISQAQYAEMFDGDAVSARGREMLEAMLIGKAFESNPNALRQLTEIKSLRQSVLSALAEISNNIQLGEDYSLESELSQAIDLAYQARKSGYSKAGDKVSGFARQGNLFQFDEGATVADCENVTVLLLADILNDNRSTRLKNWLAVYNKEAKDSAQGQMDLFTGDVKARQTIIDEVNILLNNGTEEEIKQQLEEAAEQRKAEAEQSLSEDGTGSESNEGDNVSGISGEGNKTFLDELKKFYDEYESGENGLITDGDFIEGARDLMYQHLDTESELYKRLMSAFEDYDDTHNAYLYENGMRDDDGSEAMIDVLRGVVAETETEPAGETAGTAAESPLNSLAEVKEFLKSIGYDGSISKVITSDGKKLVKYYASGSITPSIVFGETTRRDVYKQFHLYGNVAGVNIPAELEAEFTREDAEAKSISDELYANEREEIKKVLTDAGIPFVDVIDSESGSRIVFTDNKNDNGNYTDYVDVADIEQVKDDIEFIRQRAEKNKEKTFDISPLREQYDKLKGLHPDATILFRTGDTYTFVADDANDAADILGITLETDSKGTQFAFIPIAEFDKTLPKLIRAGKRVALADGIDYANPVQVAEQETDTNPTEAQKKAGNYKKGHVKIDGYDVTIENPKGSVRSGTDASGKKWEQTMHNTYGYIRGTEGVDGDHIDVFLSDNPEEGDVYVIDQVNKDGSFDEHKVMYGFTSAAEAADAYNSNYEEGWQGLGRISRVSRETFKKWINSSHRKTKPFSEYAIVNTDDEYSGTYTGIGVGIKKKEDAATEKQPTEQGKKTPYSITPTTYTNKKGKETPMFLVKFSSDLTKEQIRAGKELAKNSRGWWDREQEGFMMRSEDAAKELAEALSNEEAVADAQPMSLQDMATATEQQEPVQAEQSQEEIAQYIEEQKEIIAQELANDKVVHGTLAPESGNNDSVIYPFIEERISKNLTSRHFDVNNPSHIALAKQMFGDTGLSKDKNAEIRRNFVTSILERVREILSGEDVAAQPQQTEKPKAKITTEQEAKEYLISIGYDTSSLWWNNPKNEAEDFIEEANLQLERNSQKEAQQTEQEQPKRLVSDERMEELKARLRKKMFGQLNMGVDPEILAIGAELAVGHIERGLTKFADYAKAMIADLGDAIRPYLKSFYNAVRDMPEAEEYVEQMDSYDDVRTFDVLSLTDGETAGLLEKAEEIAKEQDAEEQAEEAKEKLTEQRNDGRKVQSEGVALDGTPLRSFKDEDLDDVNTKYYYQGKRVYVMLITRSGEQVGAMQFTQPRVERLHLSNGQSVNAEDMMVADETKAPVGNDDVQKILDIAKKGKKTSKSKKKDVSLQQEPDLFSLFGKDATNVEPNDSNNDEGRENRPSSDGVSQRAPEGSERADSGRLDGNIQEGRNVGRGNSSVSPAASGERSSSERPVRRLQSLERPANPKNLRNNHAERGKDYAPKGVDARIEANIKAIELMQQLIESGEQATPEQMAVLRQFSGWGGLGKAFNATEGRYGVANELNQRIRQLLGEEAYNQAVMSRNSAYFTPAVVIDTLWDIARAMGFQGGSVLEGSAGIGDIIGHMPTDISERSDIHAVEIDQTTGNILSLLYPDAHVDVQGFEATQVQNGSVDLAITNVPFVTGLRVNDTTGDKDLSKKFHDIHDFCIAKNVRKLREGGIGIFITSSGTLDNSAKLREWLVQEGGADVVGAFRMHNETFGGTGATSDIIVIRKRVNGKKSQHAIDVLSTTGERTADYDTGEFKRVKGEEIPVIKHMSMDYNSYFVEHPEMMAGDMHFGFEMGDTFRPTSKALYPVSGKNQEEMLKAWAESFAEKDWEADGQPMSSKEFLALLNNAVYDTLGEGVKEGSMVLDSKGELCVAQRGKAVPLGLNANKVKGHTKAECFEAYQSIKKALANLLQYQTEEEDDAGLQPLLKALNKAYDDFVKTYGHLHKNTSISFLKNDVDFANILALEKFSEKGDAKGNKIQEYGKTDIFSQRVVEKEKAPEPKNVKDSIIASIYVHGRIDLPWIVDRLNGDDGQHTEESVKAEIIASGLGFENPATRQMEVSYEYLSGNVREKLAIAQANNSDGQYDANIKALEAVIPMNIPAHLIDFSLGSSWIEPKLFEEYVKEKTDVEVSFTSAGGTWYMKAHYWVNEQKNRALGVVSEMFHKTIMGTQLIEAAMQNKTITVSEVHKDRYGSKTINDPAATQACANRIDELRQDFKEWARAKMQGDAELSERIERIYNEMFNNYVPKSIPDEFVPAHFGGAATTVDGKPFALRPHQGKAVVRGTTQPLLLAHEVGTGKTYTLISTAMEMRRLGTARKPMIVVQNATVGQFVESAKKLYPNAKVLTLDDKDHTLEGRKNFYAKIKYNDWDMIVVPQSVFERIPDSEERQMKFVQDKIDEKLLVLEQMRDADGSGKSMIVRQAEKEIGKLEEELAELTDAIAEKRDARRRERDEKKTAVAIQNAGVKALEMLDRQTDEVENFDDMGIDALLVDEAHEYKHLGFATAMQRGVKGVDSSYSKKAQGVYLKTQAVLEKNNGRNVIFATGTPISNTAAEIWTFMRYLMPADTMKEYGIFYFDDFVRNFGNLTQMLEFTTSGKFKENNRFAGYINLPELVRIWSGIADTVLTREAGGVNDKIPAMEGEKATDIYLPQTRALRSIMKYVKRKLEEFDKMSGKEKKKNSHIPLTMYGIAKAAAVDARLVMSDAEDDPNSKTNEAVRQILKSLKETASYKGTVAVFADNYQNKHSGFNLYEDIREKLIAKGVPAEQIVVMKSGMSVKKKLEIFDMVNRGDVRVIMGSTFTLGTGVNIQERLHTLIHLDAPNRPMDYTQRNGRILRQGNIHKDMDKPVRVLRFGVEDSLDVTAYQRLKTKGAIADSIMNGKQMMANSMENRALEEEEDVFGDTVAQLSGSEYAMLKNQAEKDVRKYEAKKKQYDADQTYCHNEIPKLEHDIEVWKQWIEKSRRSLDRVNEIDAQNGLTITVGKQTFASIEEMAEFIKEYNKSIKEVENELRDNPSIHSETRRLTVNIGGIDFVFTNELGVETMQDQGTLFSAVHRKMTYSCEALGLNDEPVYKSLLREGLEHIIENIISGKEFKERIERGERNLEIDEKSLVQVRERYGKPFEFTEELEKSRKRLEEYSELMKKELAEKEKKYADMDAGIEEATDVTEAEEAEEEDEDDDDSNLYRMREEEPPVRTGIGYKVFVLKDGKLYPPMVANPNGEDTPVGVWLDADAAPVAGLTKTGRQQVKAGGKGTQGGSGMLAYRPGWHLGEIPYALQFGRINPETGKKELFPANFVWAEVEYANDVDYQQEAHDAGVNANGKYQHSLAGLPYVPVNGSYKYRTNPNPETDPWIITGAMKVKRILKPSEVDELVKAAGREPQQREAGAVTDEQVEALNKEIRAKEVQKRFGELNEKYNGKPCSIIMNIDETSDDDFRKAIGISDEMVAEDTPEELHEDILKAKEDIKERKVAGGYSPDTRKIVIFAENIRSLDNLEEGFFHENLHGILHDWYEDGQRGIAERFFDVAQKEGGFVNWDFVDKRYEHLPESKKEEFFVYSLSRAMVQGRVGEILDMLADEDSERVDNILSTIGYDRRTEEASRRAKEAEGGKEVQDEVQRSLGQNDQGLLLERDGQPVLSQEDSFASSRAAGYTKKQHEAYWQRIQRNMRNAAEDWVKKLHMGDRVTIVDSVDDIDTNIKGRKRRAKGWFDRKTGKIVIVLGNHGSAADVVRTVLHEGVSHYGLRKLFGRNFLQFLDNVYENADNDVRSDIAELAAKYGWDFHTATEEYLARLAEDTDFENAQKKGWFSKIKSLFLDMLHSLGLSSYGGAALTTNELRYILWRSYENLAEPGRYRNLFDVAKDVVVQDKLGVGNYARKENVDNEHDEIDMAAETTEQRMAKMLKDIKKKHPDAFILFKGSDGFYYSLDPKELEKVAGVTSFAPRALDEVMAKLIKQGKRVGIVDGMEHAAEEVAEDSEDILARDGDFSERDRVTARDAYERMVSSGLYQFRESVQDSMLGLKKLYEAIVGKGKRIEDVDGFENAYLSENRMSSVNAAEQHDYYINFMRPLLKAISAIAGSKKGARQGLIDYMMAKHGLERNLVFAERDAREVEANGGSFADAYNKFRQNDYSGLTALTGESDLSAAEAAAQQIVNDYEAAYDTGDLWDRTREATQATLEKIFRSGLLSKEQYEKIRDMFQYYIPLQGWDETTSDEVYGYLTSRSGIGGSPIKHAVGRSSKADDPIATIAMMADSAIRNGNRNQMKQRFLNFVQNHPSDLVSVHDLWLQYDDTADEWKPVFADIEEGDTAADVERKVEAFEQRMEQLAQAEPDKYKRGRDAKNIPYKVVMGNLKEHQVLVKRSGQTYILTINGNPRAAQALNGLTNPDVETGGVVGNLLKAGEYINRNLSAFYTTRNPDFVVSNFFRDMLYSNCMTWVKESPRYALRFHKNFGKLNPATMRRLLGKWEKGTLDQSNYTERMFYQFMMNGGETGYTSVLDIEAHKKKVAEELKRYNSVGRKAWAALGLQLDLLNRGVENCARFAAFVTSREMGRSIDRSVYDAKEVSVNFNKKGSGGKMVNATGQTVLGKIGAYIGGGGRLMWVFWNAGVQGMTNFGRAGKRHSGKALAGASAMFILGYVIPQLASLMGGGDGDDDDKNAYYNFPEYVRRSNICFRAGEQWITIPLPIEFRGIYGLGELASGVISGNENYDNKELSYQIASQVSQVLPLDMLEGGGGITPFIPSGVKPFVEAYILNRAWTGMPIYKDTPWNQNDPEWTKAYKSADQTLVDATRWLNEHTGGDDFKKGAIDINPSKLEYLLNGIFGGYANTAGKLKKMGETAFGDREFEWRNILLANRVVKSGDERTANRKLQNEYFKYKKEYDETKRLLKKYENAADEGIAGMAEKVDFIHNSSAYMRYEVFDEYRSDIDDYREDIKNAADDAERRELEAEMYATMRELIDHLHEIK